MEEELLLAAEDLALEAIAEETEDVDVEEEDPAEAQTRMKKRNGNQLPSLVVL